jgi:uncharacterized membrane protein
VSLLLALHLLAAVVWVGGMAFAILVLRPSLVVLEPAQRLALHGHVFRRFFLIVWHALPIIGLTGFAIMFGYLGGFAGVNWAVHLMNLTGLVMAAIYLYVFFVPWKAMRAALSAGDNQAAVASVEQIRGLIAVNLALGLFTVFIAAFGA